VQLEAMVESVMLVVLAEAVRSVLEVMREVLAVQVQREVRVAPYI
jgi:hypothetical protein